MIGVVLPANASPACITRSAGKTTQASPLVWAAAEIVQVDLVLARAERQLVLEGLLRQELGLVALEGVHLLHVRLGVLLRDEFDRRAEELVAAGVIAVRVRVDDRGDRLVR